MSINWLPENGFGSHDEALNAHNPGVGRYDTLGTFDRWNPRGGCMLERDACSIEQWMEILCRWALRPSPEQL
jgi:hypothetical protein